MYEVYCMGRIYFDDGSIHYDNLPIKWNLIIDMPTKCLCNISPILEISFWYNLPVYKIKYNNNWYVRFSLNVD